MTTILWLRRDLRRSDHPALTAAAADGPVLPLFVVEPGLWRGAGPAPRGWLARTLQATRSAYGGLCVRVGDPATVLAEVAAEVGAGAVHITGETTPHGRRRDGAVAQELGRHGVRLAPTGTPYAVGPGSVRTQDGEPYRVFTPFSRAWRQHGWERPAPEPPGVRYLSAPSSPQAEELLDQAVSECPVDLPGAGEVGARARWSAFLADDLAGYAQGRDRPDLDATSRMSPYLKLGVVHPRTLLADLSPGAVDGRAGRGAAVDTFVTELAWREFYADVLWHHPGRAWRDLRPVLSRMSYDDAAADVEAWRRGRTGYPVVDAGMRQLLGEGWMHNRVRMITASFLTKDLHVWWPVGARHFMDHLIDADLASNNHGWQWVAGTGTDAAPYFRVFNPVTQGRKFDPDGAYVRRWVPELRHLPSGAVHEPWAAPDGYAEGYPRRLVDHAAERRVALERYERARS